MRQSNSVKTEDMVIKDITDVIMRDQLIVTRNTEWSEEQKIRMIASNKTLEEYFSKSRSPVQGTTLRISSSSSSPRTGTKPLKESRRELYQEENSIKKRC